MPTSKLCRFIIPILFTALFVFSCKTPETIVEEPAEVIVEELSEDILTPLEQFFNSSEIFKQSITGFALYDPETDSMLHDRDAHRYFTPASNTKIFTLYASLKALPDTLPALQYTVRNDTLYFRGTGDPTFLYHHFDSEESFQFLKNRQETLVYYDDHYKDEHFGSGWAWDWYMAAYAPEKAPFPIFGNMARFQTEQVSLIKLNDERPVKPAFFESYIDRLEWNSSQLPLVEREFRDNRFSYAPRADTARQERNIPFVYDRELFIEMLSDTLGRDILSSAPNRGASGIEFDRTLYSTPADTVYRRLMLVSDNFIAEQLMLMISNLEFGEMETDRAISHALEEFFDFLPDRPRWSDGSGLTRYNLMTPRSIIALLDKLYDEYGEDKILPMFPAGGTSGTIRGWYAPPDGQPPYVYAKTGTLRNNHILSGYIYTDSGRRLIFSFMNNNYVVSNTDIRREMQKVLELIRQQY